MESIEGGGACLRGSHRSKDATIGSCWNAARRSSLVRQKPDRGRLALGSRCGQRPHRRAEARTVVDAVESRGKPTAEPKQEGQMPGKAPT